MVKSTGNIILIQIINQVNSRENALQNHKIPQACLGFAECNATLRTFWSKNFAFISRNDQVLRPRDYNVFSKR
jgi:hypothetical protein